MFKTTDSKITLFLSLLAFLIYGNTIMHDYAWDDSIVITENSRVQKGVSGIPNLFLKYNSDYKSDKYGYRPIVLSSFAIDLSLFGLNPHAGHAMQVFYFSLLCAVLYRVLRRIFYRYSNLAPFLISLLFIVHPVHTEVVANIKSRDELFALLFGLLSIMHFINYQQQKRIRFLIYGSLLFILSFLSKESAIVFLAVIPLTLYYMDETLNYKKLLFPGVIVAFLGILSFVIVSIYTGTNQGKAFSEGAGIYYESNILGNSFFYSGTWNEKLANAFHVLALYAGNFFMPVRQLYYYGYNQVPVTGWGNVLVVLSMLLHVGSFLFALLRFNKYREISYGILFYLISVSLYTHVFRALADTIADRFLFVPSIGLIMITVFLFGKWFRINFGLLAVEQLVSLSFPKTVKGFTYTMLFITVLFAIKTLSRNADWKNNETLITHDMPYLEQCSRAHQYYADILMQKLRKGYDPAVEKSMIGHYTKSIQISPEAYYARLALGTYYCSIKKYAEGISVLQSAVQVFPKQADPYFYLGEALFRTNRFYEATVYLEKSFVLAPAVFNTYYYLALAYSKDQATGKALETIELAKEKFGESKLIYDALGNIYFDAGDLEQSTKYTFEQLRFGEDPQKVYGTVIGRYQSKKADAPAAFYYRQALEKGIFKPN